LRLTVHAILNIVNEMNQSGGVMPRGVKKEHLPEKICPVCGRPFTWRKKWADDWENVKYCSKRCRNRKHESDTNPERTGV